MDIVGAIPAVLRCRNAQGGVGGTADKREHLRQLSLEEGGLGGGNVQPGQRRDAGNREVFASGGHGRC
jgi:hypothetical protein